MGAAAFATGLFSNGTNRQQYAAW